MSSASSWTAIEAKFGTRSRIDAPTAISSGEQNAATLTLTEPIRTTTYTTTYKWRNQLCQKKSTKKCRLLIMIASGSPAFSSSVLCAVAGKILQRKDRMSNWRWTATNKNMQVKLITRYLPLLIYICKYNIETKSRGNPSRESAL